MFKKGDIVFYPNHGKGLVRKIYKDKDNILYYEVVYQENLEILVPVKSAEVLGMRYPMKKEAILKTLRGAKNIKIDEEDLQNIEKTVQGLFVSGEFKDTVYLIKLLKRLKKDRKKINKNLELSQRYHLDQARVLFKSEALHVLGEKGEKDIKFLL